MSHRYREYAAHGRSAAQQRTPEVGRQGVRKSRSLCAWIDGFRISTPSIGSTARRKQGSAPLEMILLALQVRAVLSGEERRPGHETRHGCARIRSSHGPNWEPRSGQPESGLGRLAGSLVPKHKECRSMRARRVRSARLARCCKSSSWTFTRRILRLATRSQLYCACPLRLAQSVSSHSRGTQTRRMRPNDAVGPQD